MIDKTKDSHIQSVQDYTQYVVDHIPQAIKDALEGIPNSKALDTQVFDEEGKCVEVEHEVCVFVVPGRAVGPMKSVLGMLYEEIRDVKEIEIGISGFPDLERTLKNAIDGAFTQPTSGE